MIGCVWAARELCLLLQAAGWLGAERSLYFVFVAEEAAPV